VGLPIYEDGIWGIDRTLSKKKNPEKNEKSKIKKFTENP